MVETNPYETPFQVESTTGLRLNRERQDASPTARRDSTRVIPAVVCLILGYSLVGMSLAFSCVSPMAAWVVAFGYPHVPSWMFFGLWRIPNRDPSPVLSVALGSSTHELERRNWAVLKWTIFL